LSLMECLIAGGIAAVGATLQGSIGFGLALSTAPFLILIDPLFVPGPILFAAVVLNLFMSYRERRTIVLREVRYAIAGRLVGAIAGAGFLTVVPQAILSVVFGILVLFAVAVSAVGVHLPPNPKNLFGAGTLSGFMGTTSSIGGPPMALIYQNVSGARLRGMLAGFFVVGATINVVSLALIGRFGFAELQLAGVLIPGIMIGFGMSHWTANRLDRGLMRPAVLAISALAGLIVIARSLF